MRPSSRSLPSLLSGAAILAVPAVAAFLAIRALAPPSPLPADAPQTEFSAYRAAGLLKTIASEPHPAGTPAHDAVRDLIVGMWRDLGLSPEIQSGTHVGAKDHYGARVQNILVRLPGKSPTAGRALLFAAHYDSVEPSFGASDDGAGVATLLETARALRSGPPLAEDVIFLITDGEEDGTIGAQVFRDQHPWFKDVALALNLEARGTSGPALMFESSPGNSRLVRALAKTPHPRAFSFSNLVYKHMPNNTDLSIFMEGGLQGMNFAYIDRPYDYHTPNDNLADLNLRSLQHQGSYMLALAREFGNGGVPQRSAGDEVYFGLFGDVFVHYSRAVAFALAGLALLLFIGAVIIALLRRRIRASRAALGIGFLAGSVVLAAGLGFAFMAAVKASHGHWLQAGPYSDSPFYALALAFLAAGATAIVYSLVKAGTRGPEPAFGAAAVWVVMAGLGALQFPDLSYIMGLPALLLAATLLVWVLCRGVPATGHPGQDADPGLLSSLGAVTLISILAAPVIFLFFLAMSLANINAAVLGAMTALMITAAAPALELMRARLGKALPVALLLLFAVFAIAGAITTRYSARVPHWISLTHLSDFDKGQAYWVVSRRDVFPWTEALAGGTFKPGHPQPEYVGQPGNYVYREAPKTEALPPDVRVTGDRTDGGKRTLKFRISSPKGGRQFVIQCAGEGITAGTLEGQALEIRSAKGFAAVFINPGREGFEVGVEASAGTPVVVKVRESDPGLPALSGSSLPPPPAGFGLSWARVLLFKTFTFK